MAAAAAAHHREELTFTASARVTFASHEHAAMAARALAVDDELQPTKAAKDFAAEGAVLVGHFHASEARVLRVMLASFYDMLGVTLRTLRDFS